MTALVHSCLQQDSKGIYSGDDDSANNRVHLKPFDNIFVHYSSIFS